MTATTRRPFMSGWRIAYCLDGGLYPPRVYGNDVEHWKSLLRLGGARPPYAAVRRASCQAAILPGGQLSSSPRHTPPASDCTCGIYLVERAENLPPGLDRDLRQLQRGYGSWVNRWARENLETEGPPPGVAIYRALVMNAIPAPDYGDRPGWVPDPPGTWRAAAALVAGPIFTSDTGQVDALAERYEVEAIALPQGSSIDATVKALAAVEPPTGEAPCLDCSFTTAHDVSCEQFEPWWQPVLTASEVASR